MHHEADQETADQDHSFYQGEGPFSSQDVDEDVGEEEERCSQVEEKMKPAPAVLFEQPKARVDVFA